MTVGGIADYLKQHWPAVRERLLNGTYEPKPVRRVEIPKPDGGMRKLGIPTVLDRLPRAAVRLRQPSVELSSMLQKEGITEPDYDDGSLASESLDSKK